MVDAQKLSMEKTADVKKSVREGNTETAMKPASTSAKIGHRCGKQITRFVLKRGGEAGMGRTVRLQRKVLLKP